ncbi:LRRN4 C-terminal-like protein [Melanotaenia boesemani]|uniref:LRRN4 C-terminal-like protein n=1 Tax=Melanotaenia boesemani TaxID=1250792 RepID=UPI001C04F53B|nr:LRRN4 C-terminal-like protein [Melanotaenia boesemani]
MRNLPFPLVIICLLSIKACCPLPTTSGATGTYPRGHGLVTDPYYDYEDTTSSAVSSSPKGTLQRCDYDRCRERQIPCRELSASTGCLCPGFTLSDQAPGEPILKSVSLNGSVVVVQWCEPLSYVTSYIVTVGGQERQKFGRDQRSGTAGKIDNIAEVCVVAVNEAGQSDGSCMMYQPTDNSLPLTAGLIGGSLGFLLLLLLAVLLWRRRRQRKYEASVSMMNTAEAQ